MSRNWIDFSFATFPRARFFAGLFLLASLFVSVPANVYVLLCIYPSWIDVAHPFLVLYPVPLMSLSYSGCIILTT